MHDTTETQLDDEEDKQAAEPQVVGLEKITSPDLMGVILQKGSPRLRRFSRRSGGADLRDVASDGSFGKREAEIAQFILNAFGSSQPIIQCHRVDERDDL